jgi:hypothetical protein
MSSKVQDQNALSYVPQAASQASSQQNISSLVQGVKGLSRNLPLRIDLIAKRKVFGKSLHSLHQMSLQKTYQAAW